MQHHPIVLLVQKIELHYPKEIRNYFSGSKKQRSEKLYKLISSAKNEEQLERGLLFKKLFSKAYSEKNDYLWRNEIRLLKEELENFLIEIEHQHISKDNEAYNDWLLVQAFSRLKYNDGIDEKTELLLKQKDNFASYHFVLDACFIRIDNLRYKITDLNKRRQFYPELLKECREILNNLIAANCAELNLYMTQCNWINYNHHIEYREQLIQESYTIMLPKNPISNFYNHFAASLSDNDSKTVEAQIASLDAALENIELIYKNNKLLQEHRVNALIAKGREYSSNGLFKEADEVLKSIKHEIDTLYRQDGTRTIYYTNYITNLVKCKLYKEALYVMEHEFFTENPLYKNMLLQNRLLCYLYLRDTENLSKYISYDLDSAPFPQNYMLKTIKSVYFYLMKEFDTAISIITSQTQSVSNDKMVHYKSICILYKKLYSVSQKNAMQKKMPTKDIQMLQQAVNEFEEITPTEFKMVSVYLWLKLEIEQNLA